MSISKNIFSKKRVKKSMKKIPENTKNEHLIANIEKLENDSVFLVDLEKMKTVLFVNIF